MPNKDLKESKMNVIKLTASKKLSKNLISTMLLIGHYAGAVKMINYF